MTDRCFLALLGDVVSVRRPQVGVSAVGNPRTPTYPVLAEDVPCALQPLADGLGNTVVEEMEAATHTAYLQPMDLQAGDLLVEAHWVGALGAEVRQGSTRVTLAAPQEVGGGTWLEIGSGAGSELVVVLGSAVDGMELASPLARDHVSGERMRGVDVLRVEGVRDEGGVNHHLKANLRRLVG